jgi:hypothetical protein
MGVSTSVDCASRQAVMLPCENNGETRKVLLEVPHAMGVGMQTLPGALLCIAQRLETVKLRSDYRQRLLVLCSDVGRAAEAKEGRFVYYLLVKVVWVSQPMLMVSSLLQDDLV